MYGELEQKLNSNFKLNYGFVEQAQPSLHEAIMEHINSGVKEIIIVPALLFSGVHITHDIPFVVQSIKNQHFWRG